MKKWNYKNGESCMQMGGERMPSNLQSTSLVNPFAPDELQNASMDNMMKSDQKQLSFQDAQGNTWVLDPITGKYKKVPNSQFPASQIGLAMDGLTTGLTELSGIVDRNRQDSAYQQQMVQMFNAPFDDGRSDGVKYGYSFMKKGGKKMKLGGDAVSMLGYKDGSPFNNAPFLDINSNNITMQDVNQDLLAIPDVGSPIIMKANSLKNYKFPNAKRVREVPLMQTGGLWQMDNKIPYIDSTLSANKNLDWVKRLYQKNPQTIKVPGQLYPSTHLMSYDPNSKRVYPEIVNKSGQLQHLTGDAAWDYADSTNSFIKFPTSEQSKWFAENYKKGTGVLKGFKKGGKMQSGGLQQVYNFLFDDEDDNITEQKPTAPTSEDVPAQDAPKDNSRKMRNLAMMQLLQSQQAPSQFMQGNISDFAPTQRPYAPNESIATNEDQVIEAAAMQNGIPASILKGVYGAETSFGKNINTSSAGAKGAFQFMSGTARQYGVDVNDFNSSALGAAKYMKDLYAQFGNWPEAIAAYNAGPGNVRSGKYKSFKETMNYVPKVLKYAQQFSGQFQEQNQ